jgi:hypothetical protein
MVAVTEPVDDDTPGPWRGEAPTTARNGASPNYVFLHAIAEQCCGCTSAGSFCGAVRQQARDLFRFAACAMAWKLLNRRCCQNNRGTACDELLEILKGRTTWPDTRVTDMPTADYEMP